MAEPLDDEHERQPCATCATGGAYHAEQFTSIREGLGRQPRMESTQTPQLRTIRQSSRRGLLWVGGDRVDPEVPGGPEALGGRLVRQTDPPLQIEVEQTRRELQLFELSQELRSLALQVVGIERVADVSGACFTRLRQEWIDDGQRFPREIAYRFCFGELVESFEGLGGGAIAKFERGMVTDRFPELVG